MYNDYIATWGRSLDFVTAEHHEMSPMGAVVNMQHGEGKELNVVEGRGGKVTIRGAVPRS